MVQSPTPLQRLPRSPEEEALERAHAQKAAQLAQTRAYLQALIPSTSASPLDVARKALRDFQHGPSIGRPSFAQSLVPVVGSAWEAAGDLQDGAYGSAALNGVMAVAEAFPLGLAARGFNAAQKGVGIFKKRSTTSGAAVRQYRKRLGVKSGDEVHHSVPLNGIPRNVPNWRNHYAFLKVLPQETHQRLHRSWNGKPPFDPARRLWYGTTDWMKAAPAGIAAYTADVVENFSRPPVAKPENQPKSRIR